MTEQTRFFNIFQALRVEITKSPVTSPINPELFRQILYLTKVHVYLPAHGSVLQALVSLAGPEHCAPPPDGGGFVQVRERSCCPPPQSALHCPQFPKAVHPPFTPAERNVPI